MKGCSIMTNKQVGGLIVMFGAAGDLARRKLYPSLFRLYQRQLLSENFALLGNSRREWSDDYFREIVLDSISDQKADETTVNNFIQHFFYVSHDATKAEDYDNLKTSMDKLAEEFNTGGKNLYYLSTAPSIFPDITKGLKDAGIVTDGGTHRVILEKPFGTDLASAGELNKALEISFDEKDIYRIDHYLGKEMVQNILTTRYFNPVVEAMLNSQYVSNIQITLAEDMPVGTRGGYYDKSGAIRDMFQNHILQVATLLGMELPENLDQDAVHASKLAFMKEIASFTPEQTDKQMVRAQYTASSDGEFINYLDENEVAKDSVTETYLAGYFQVNNDRWGNVPFYFKTGKALAVKHTTVEIILNEKVNEADIAKPCNPDQTRITFSIQPETGIAFHLNQKLPGEALAPNLVTVNSDVDELIAAYVPDAYEKLIYDALIGDQTNFSTWNELAEQWRIVDSIIENWKDDGITSLPTYEGKSRGPKEADELLRQNGHCWVQ
ncbi:glucose-6-phosphate dehydrogenase [Aerococcus agrisoli]|uniref:Glucose-6-phosphate 1-dehydrogenase n=2 Tax=Aerococcus agrisoli TaxID=2487350 RepID=A0A3N4GN90_9LACT|nr:glucose-6-phosphate dehydrogenase [Aerococcus agrisoli]